MKFAHEFKEALLKEGFPAHWVDSAIPYRQLKKCIKKVERELHSIGLDSVTLAHLIESSQEAESTGQPSGVILQYDFNGEQRIRPKLTLLIQFEDGLAVDAVFSDETRSYLENLALSQSPSPRHSLSDAPDCSMNGSRARPTLKNTDQSGKSGHLRTPGQTPVIQRVEVPLIFDTEFFNVLQNDVTNLDGIQETEQQVLTVEISALSTHVKAISKPSKYSKTDLYRWRELFELYIDASPFFSTRECDSGSRNSKTAARQLQWFQTEVTKRGLVEAFKLSASRKALDKFVAINVTLLQSLSFQEINQRAVSKILKKFDKRTKLGATKSFPKLLQSDSIMSETMAKAICAQMSTDLIKIVPQVDDHLCPICFTIYWRPIRMKCRHVFCIRCTVLMQRQKKKLCPLCRDDVVMEADTDNIDVELVQYLKKHFPKETREKQVAIETAIGIETFGIYYKHPSQYDCAVM